MSHIMYHAMCFSMEGKLGVILCIKTMLCVLGWRVNFESYYVSKPCYVLSHIAYQNGPRIWED